ncbi:MAG TPA: hypothetical protein VEB65_06155, partial [Solirubrobacterales bacterium]|nr:hypothetical protein [Solirubrobacterales bacterium]
ALAFTACGGGGDGTSSATSDGGAGQNPVGDLGLVSAYCLYGANSQAQMKACEKRTTPAQVRSADDEAARWARGELKTCGKGAGELCLYYRPSDRQTEREAP